MIIARVLRVVLLLTSCLCINQVFAAVVEHHWNTNNSKERDAVVELERFLRLLFIEDQQMVESMESILVTVDTLPIQDRLVLLASQDVQGNTFFDHVILAWKQVHQNNKFIYIEFIKLLIDYGINLNRQNKQGNTALHLAYQVGSAEIVAALELNDSVNKDIKNGRGEIARQQIISPSVQYQSHEIPSIGENLYWCFKALCILHDGECF